MGDTTYYLYDEAGQLVDSSSDEYQTTMTYDNGGNIVSKTTVFEQSETYSYEYGNANWPDQLTKFNGKAITYDAIDNPLSYDGKTYTWTSGRELASITSADMSLIFKYNDSGLRTHKIVMQNGVTTTYTYAWSQDGRLISQSDGTTTLYFVYDENSEIIGFSKLTASSNEMYYYVKNLQGDVCAIVDSTGATVVSYVYDAWGYLINITGSQATTLGVLNPIRYRGYYYDTETGYYYLQSRYYDPLWGRFINADAYVYINTTTLGVNTYLYCYNSPLIHADATGFEPTVIVVSDTHYVVRGELSQKKYRLFFITIRIPEYLFAVMCTNYVVSIDFKMEEESKEESRKFWQYFISSYGIEELCKCVDAVYRAKYGVSIFTHGRSKQGVKVELILHLYIYYFDLEAKYNKNHCNIVDIDSNKYDGENANWQTFEDIMSIVNLSFATFLANPTIIYLSENAIKKGTESSIISKAANKYLEKINS